MASSPGGFDDLGDAGEAEPDKAARRRRRLEARGRRVKRGQGSGIAPTAGRDAPPKPGSPQGPPTRIRGAWSGPGTPPTAARGAQHAARSAGRSPLQSRPPGTPTTPGGAVRVSGRSQAGSPGGSLRRVSARAAQADSEFGRSLIEELTLDDEADGAQLARGISTPSSATSVAASEGAKSAKSAAAARVAQTAAAALNEFDDDSSDDGGDGAPDGDGARQQQAHWVETSTRSDALLRARMGGGRRDRSARNLPGLLRGDSARLSPSSSSPTSAERGASPGGLSPASPSSASPTRTTPGPASQPSPLRRGAGSATVTPAGTPPRRSGGKGKAAGQRIAPDPTAAERGSSPPRKAPIEGWKAETPRVSPVSTPADDAGTGEQPPLIASSGASGGRRAAQIMLRDTSAARAAIAGGGANGGGTAAETAATGAGASPVERDASERREHSVDEADVDLDDVVADAGGFDLPQRVRQQQRAAEAPTSAGRGVQDSGALVPRLPLNDIAMVNLSDSDDDAAATVAQRQPSGATVAQSSTPPVPAELEPVVPLRLSPSSSDSGSSSDSSSDSDSSSSGLDTDEEAAAAATVAPSAAPAAAVDVSAPVVPANAWETSRGSATTYDAAEEGGQWYYRPDALRDDSRQAQARAWGMDTARELGVSDAAPVPAYSLEAAGDAGYAAADGATGGDGSAVAAAADSGAAEQPSGAVCRTEGDVDSFAAYLGIDAKQDPDLVWIAEEAMYAPLPEGWYSDVVPVGQGLEGEGHTYYWSDDSPYVALSAPRVRRACCVRAPAGVCMCVLRRR